MPLDKPAGPVIHNDLIQGDEAWLAARCGLLTASEMKLILTPTLKIAQNDKQLVHLYELLAQRMTGHVEPHFISDDMLRGHDDEEEALSIYCSEIERVEAAGFITNDKWGFTLGYSPDGMVGDKGLVECKSRRQKYQAQTILDHVCTGSATIPADFVLQCQTGLMVAEREWLDFISYCGGMPMVVIRIYPDQEVQTAILEAAEQFEAALTDAAQKYRAAMSSDARLYPTERKEREIIL